MDKTDRRIARTQRMLMEALIALALEKSYDAISIRDITERADIAYSTFFRHYGDKDDLLAEGLKSAVDDLKRLISRSADKTPEAEGLLIFQHVAANAAFFRVLFDSPGTGGVMQRLKAESVADVLEGSNFPADGMVPPEIIANNYIAAVLALIRWWLDHDMPYSVERMATIYSRLIVQGIADVTAPDS